MPAPAPYLSVRSITKRFDKTAAVDDVSLDVREGEFLCLLGPSGCGKTTLLRMIAGLERPDAGTIIQGGQDVTALPPGRRDFGIVFQSYALFPNLTVNQNVAYGLENLRQPRAAINERVAQMLKLVGLEEFGQRYPAQLSGGQQQRVALARALAIAPGLLLLDEPLSALDARVRASLRGELAGLQRSLGVTTIMVTHDQEEALTMADRIVVMDRGRVAQTGAPLEVYQSPATPFVADFVGHMNFLSGRVAVGHTARVLLGSSLLYCDRCEEAWEPGMQVLLAIRPEEVQVIEGGYDSANVIETRVQEVEFVGPFHRLHLRLSAPGSEGTALTAHLPAHTASKALRKGGRVNVHLPSHSLRVYPAAT
jgi:iron(III) transport system ATP-binding protein